MCVCVTKPLQQPLPWSVNGAGQRSCHLVLQQAGGTAQGELALLPALFVPVLATEKTSTFRALVLSPLHKV